MSFRDRLKGQRMGWQLKALDAMHKDPSWILRIFLVDPMLTNYLLSYTYVKHTLTYTYAHMRAL